MGTQTPQPDTSATAPNADSEGRQQQRFEWFAERIGRWVGYYEVPELERFAEGSAAWPGQREKALVLLALTDTDEARRALEELEVADDPEPFRRLYRVALDRAGVESE